MHPARQSYPKRLNHEPQTKTLQHARRLARVATGLDEGTPDEDLVDALLAKGP